MKFSPKAALAVLLPAAVLAATPWARAANGALTVSSLYYNNASAPVTFTGATGGDTVALYYQGSLDGTTTAGASGTGSITPTPTALNAGGSTADQTASIVLYECTAAVSAPSCGPTAGGDLVDQTGTTTVEYNVAPTQSGVTSTGYYLADTLPFTALNAIPYEPVRLYIDGTLVDTETADVNGEVLRFGIPHNPDLSVGTHTYYMTTVDADGVQSSARASGSFTVRAENLDFAGEWASGWTTVDISRPTLKASGIDPHATLVTLFVLSHDAPAEVASVNPRGAGVVSLTPNSPVAGGRRTFMVTQTVSGAESQGLVPSYVEIDTLTPKLKARFSGTSTGTIMDPSFTVTDADTGASNHLNGPVGISGTDNQGLGVKFHVTDDTTRRSFTHDVLYSAGLKNPTLGRNLTPRDSYTVYATTVDSLGDRGTAHSNPVTFTVGTPATRAQVTKALRSALSTLTGTAATTKAILKAGGFPLSFDAPAPGRVMFAWYATVRGRKTTIGAVTSTVHKPGRTTVKVKLDAAGQKLFKRSSGAITIRETGVFTPQGGKSATSAADISVAP